MESLSVSKRLHPRLDQQLYIIEKKEKDLQQQIDEVAGTKNKLLDKRSEAMQIIDSVSASAPDPEMHTKLSYYETILRQIQSTLSGGLPEGQEKRNQFYNMVFRGILPEHAQDASSSAEQEPSQSQASVGSEQNEQFAYPDGSHLGSRIGMPEVGIDQMRV